MRYPAALWTRLRHGGFLARGAALSLVVVVLYVVVIPWAWYLGGWAGVGAAAAAAGVCLLAAAAALGVSHLLRGPQSALYGLLLAMLLRTGIPLGLTLAVQLQRGGLAEAGFVYYVLPFYLVTLGVETALSLPETRVAGGRVDPPDERV